MFKNAKEILDYIKKEDVKLVDIRFIDLPGIQHHFNVPAGAFDESVFTDGLMFDGSSIRGFQSIHESDMKLLPIPSSAYLDPYRKEKTLIVLFSVHNPIDNTPYSRDPRGVLTKAVQYLKSTGIAAKNSTQMAHLHAVTAHVSRAATSLSHQQINSQIFAMKS